MSSARSTLITAISEVIEQSLFTSTSDSLVRLELPGDAWPIWEALSEIQGRREIRVYCSRAVVPGVPFIHPLTADAAVATRWRNDEGRTYGILLLGAPSGNLDAGLRDAKSISRVAVVTKWSEYFVHPVAPNHEVYRLISHIFSKLASGGIAIQNAIDFLDQAVLPNAATELGQELWRLGVARDSQGTNTAESVERLTENQFFIQDLHAAEDRRLLERLRVAAQSTVPELATSAAHALRYWDDRDAAHLQHIDFQQIRDVVPPPPPDRVPAIGLFALLDFHGSDPLAVAGCVTALGELCEQDKPLIVSNVVFAGRAQPTKVEVRWEGFPPVTPTNLSPSVGGSTGGFDPEGFRTDPDDGFDPDDQQETANPGTNYPEARWSFGIPSTLGGPCEPVLGSLAASQTATTLELGQEFVCEHHLLSVGATNHLPEVKNYLHARRALAPYETRLGRSRTDAVTLLLLSCTARNAVRSFLDAWITLAESVSTRIGNGIAVEYIQMLETVSGPTLDNAAWRVLGPLHPFRLDPLIRACDHVLETLTAPSTISHLGRALRWIIEYAYPAYPTIFLKGVAFGLTSLTLTPSSTEKPAEAPVYLRVAGQMNPEVTTGDGLAKVVSAIKRFQPWLSTGLSVSVIDPPSGGGVVDALRKASTPSGGEGESTGVTVYQQLTSTRTGDVDDYDGKVVHLPSIDDLDDAGDFPPTNIIVRFASRPASSGQPAPASWGTTRGTHLLYALHMPQARIFQSAPVPEMRIAPHSQNRVVSASQGLVAAVTGQEPAQATISPLMTTQDARVISRLGGSTDWVIFAAPGPLGLISPSTINSALKYVGRHSMGPYGLYVYATDNLYPVRRYFEQEFLRFPLANVPTEAMVNVIVAKAQKSGGAVLFATGTDSASQFACLVALDIAQEAVDGRAVDPATDVSVVVSLDEVSWTRAWLREGTRADFLIAFFTPRGVTLRVVESKSNRGGTRIACNLASAQFQESCLQIDHTLEVLREICTPVTATFSEDLRFGSLVEHLMAGLLSATNDVATDLRARCFEQMNRLARRDESPEFDSYAVLTQPAIQQVRDTVTTVTGTILVWAGAPEIASSFGGSGSVTTGTTLQTPVPTPAGQPEPHRSTLQHASVNPGSTEGDPGTSDPDELRGSIMKIGAIEIAKQFIGAARQRGIRMEHEPSWVTVGPTLIAFGAILPVGGRVDDLKRVIEDVARDIGRGAQHHLMSVENDSNPQTVRVLIPRADREFPRLPNNPATLGSSEAGYVPLYVGKTIDGADHVSTLDSWPHLLVAGTTGSGKTTFLRSIFTQLARFGPRHVQLIMVDGKGEVDYDDLDISILHPDFPTVVNGASRAVEVLEWCIAERDRRVAAIQAAAPEHRALGLGVKQIDIYKRALETSEPNPLVRPLVIVIDEFADLMMQQGPESRKFEDSVQRLVQVGRSSLMHLVLGTQRPDAKTLSGRIRANLGGRAIFNLPTFHDSMTALAKGGAETLAGKGDMLFLSGNGQALRLQGYNI